MPVPLSTSSQVKNNLLSALVSHDYQHLLPRLERVHMFAGDVVYRADDRAEYAYFPEDTVLSLLSTLEDGTTTEVGLIGREGMAGLSIILGGDITHDLALVQVEGNALRMRASVLREEIRLGSPLQLLLLRDTQSFITLISQSIICSQHHSIEQRYARWVLMISDHVGPGKLRLTQELIANMIGSRRAGITKVALTFRKAGVISYVRGYLTISDREGLEASACECYGVIRDEFDRLHTSQLFARKSA
jgi:CRP-like cAMP-binding protein